MTDILEIMLLLTLGLMTGFVIGSLATTQYRAVIERNDQRDLAIGYRRAERKEETRIADILKSL